MNFYHLYNFSVSFEVIATEHTELAKGEIIIKDLLIYDN